MPTRTQKIVEYQAKLEGRKENEPLVVHSITAVHTKGEVYLTPQEQEKREMQRLSYVNELAAQVEAKKARKRALK